MPAPRLVATDLDGTLVRSDETVSAFSAEVLAELDRRGVPVVFVTARPLRWMDDLWPMAGGHGLAIVSNGAIVYDVARQTVREVHGIDPSVGLEITARISAALPRASYAIECLSGLRRDPTFIERHPVPEGSPVGPLAEIWDEPAVKLLVRAEGVDPEVLRASVIHAVGDLAQATWSIEGLVEISARGVTKASALAALAEELGVPAAEIVAFGDMPNDLPMLAWVGLSYAMANGHPSVVEAADHVAPDHDEDGVARTLVDLFALGLTRS